MPKGYTRSDERIREDVCDRLSDADVECEEVMVTVENGVVVLSGSAPSGESRREIERIAESVSGVKDVTNQIHTGSRRAEQQQQESEGRKSASFTTSPSKREGTRTT